METVTIRAYREVSDPDEEPFATVDVEADAAVMEEAVLALERQGAKSFDFSAAIPVLDKTPLGGYYEGDLDAVVGE